jgi:hypothetical protein
MAIVLRSLYGTWLVVTAIAGSMLSMSSVSDGATTANNPRSAAVHGTAGCSSSAAVDDLQVSDNGRDARTHRRTEPVAGHFCFGTHADGSADWSQQPYALPLKVDRLLHKNTDELPGAPARVVPPTRMRVTRLQNGSILCCRERPHGHIAAMFLDATDDTASDGDDTADDDDSQDNQNGDDDTDLQIIAWIPLTILYLGVPPRKATAAWTVPSFPPFSTLQRLRC